MGPNKSGAMRYSLQRLKKTRLHKTTNNLGNDVGESTVFIRIRGVDLSVVGSDDPGRNMPNLSLCPRRLFG